MEWGTAGADTLFEDKDGRCFLPARMAARVVRWVRPRDLVAQKKGELIPRPCFANMQEFAVVPLSRSTSCRSEGWTESNGIGDDFSSKINWDLQCS